MIVFLFLYCIFEKSSSVLESICPISGCDFFDGRVGFVRRSQFITSGVLYDDPTLTHPAHPDTDPPQTDPLLLGYTGVPRANAEK